MASYASRTHAVLQGGLGRALSARSPRCPRTWCSSFPLESVPFVHSSSPPGRAHAGFPARRLRRPTPRVLRAGSSSSTGWPPSRPASARCAGSRGPHRRRGPRSRRRLPRAPLGVVVRGRVLAWPGVGVPLLRGGPGPRLPRRRGGAADRSGSLSQGRWWPGPWPLPLVRGERSLMFVLLSPSSTPAVPPTLWRWGALAPSLGCGAYRVAHRFGFLSVTPGSSSPRATRAWTWPVPAATATWRRRRPRPKRIVVAWRSYRAPLVRMFVAASARGRGRAAAGRRAGGPDRVPRRRAGRRARASAGSCAAGHARSRGVRWAVLRRRPLRQRGHGGCAPGEARATPASRRGAPGRRRAGCAGGRGPSRGPGVEGAQPVRGRPRVPTPLQLRPPGSTAGACRGGHAVPPPARRVGRAARHPPFL